MENSNLYRLANKNLGKEILLDQLSDDKFRVLEFGESQLMKLGIIIL